MRDLLLLLRGLPPLLQEAAPLRQALHVCSAVHRGDAGTFLEALCASGWRQQVAMAPLVEQVGSTLSSQPPVMRDSSNKLLEKTTST